MRITPPSTIWCGTMPQERSSGKMGLSTLLHLDQESKQTMVFTSVRCDAADHIYLTATIDEQEYLMALDSQGNLCPVQGLFHGYAGGRICLSVGAQQYRRNASAGTGCQRQQRPFPISS